VVSAADSEKLNIFVFFDESAQSTSITEGINLSLYFPVI
jgi:hypothetical protein